MVRSGQTLSDSGILSRDQSAFKSTKQQQNRSSTWETPVDLLGRLCLSVFCILNHWHVVFQETETVGEVLVDVVRRGSSIVSLSDEPGGTIG